jgi:hypothetical protein
MDDLEMERLVCQMKAVMRARWPEKYSGRKPDLKVVKPVEIPSPTAKTWTGPRPGARLVAQAMDKKAS